MLQAAWRSAVLKQTSQSGKQEQWHSKQHNTSQKQQIALNARQKHIVGKYMLRVELALSWVELWLHALCTECFCFSFRFCLFILFRFARFELGSLYAVQVFPGALPPPPSAPQSLALDVAFEAHSSRSSATLAHRNRNTFVCLNATLPSPCQCCSFLCSPDRTMCSVAPRLCHRATARPPIRYCCCFDINDNFFIFKRRKY